VTVCGLCLQEAQRAVESNPFGNCALAIFLYEYAHPADMWKIEGPETASNARCPRQVEVDRAK
jgi:hypothetical protein